MLMVIFGAGASYDSSPTHPAGQISAENRPPLAKELFANRPLFIEALDQFPQCKPTVPRLRDPNIVSGRESIENLLQEIGRQSESFPQGKHELAAVKCYLQRAVSQCEQHWYHITHGVTNQLFLVREIERLRKGSEPALLVTFNYDSILEGALSQRGMRFGCIEDYTQGHELFRVFKLHGSTNWGQEFDNQLPANISLSSPLTVLRSAVEQADALRLSDRYRLCAPNMMGVADNVPVFPAIAIPVEKKATFQCPAYMIGELTSFLPQVDKIIMIGWRATEDHFFALLRQHLRRGVFVSIVVGDRNEAEETRVRINRALIDRPPNSIGERHGFTDFLRSRRAEEILSADVRVG